MKYLIPLAWIIFTALAYFLRPDNLSWIAFCVVAVFYSLACAGKTVEYKINNVTNKGSDE